MRARSEWTTTVPSVERLITWDRLRLANPYVWDALLAVTMFAFAFVNESWFYDSQVHRGVDHPSGLVLIALACAPLAWRRRAPIAALALTAIPVVAYGAMGYPGDFVGIAFVIRSSWRRVRMLSSSPTAKPSAATSRPPGTC